MLPRPPMLTKKYFSAFKLGAGLVCAGLLTGCLPPGPKALVDGQRRLEQGDLPQAIERLETATALMHTNAHAWNYLGIAYHQAGQWTNAARAYQKALQADRNLLETRLNYGSLLLEMGRAADAKTEFTAYTLRRPSATEGFERLATAELRLRELATAEAHARKAIQLDGENAEAWNTLGLVLLQRGWPAEAAQSFSAALRLQPDYAAALMNLAVVSHRQLGDRAQAVKLYRQYVALEPRPVDADAVTALADQLERELSPARPVVAVPVKSPPVIPATTTAPPVTAKVPVAVSNAPTAPPAARPVVSVPPPPKPEAPVMVKLPPEPVIRSEPDRVPPLPTTKAAPTTASATRPPVVAPATNSTASAKPAPARKEGRSVLESVNPLKLFRREPKPAARVTPLPDKEPGTVPSSVVVVTPEAGAGPVTPTAARAGSGFARYEFRGSINVASGDRAAAETFLAQGNALMVENKYGEATQAYQQAAQADPSWYQAYFNQAAAALEAGLTAEALSAGETAVALKPESADARYNFALALRRGNFVPDAAAQLEKLLVANPDDVRAHLTLGNIYAEQLRLNDQARVHYQRVLKLAPRHPQAQAIRYWLAANPK